MLDNCQYFDFFDGKISLRLSALKYLDRIGSEEALMEIFAVMQEVIAIASVGEGEEEFRYENAIVRVSAKSSPTWLAEELKHVLMMNDQATVEVGPCESKDPGRWRCDAAWRYKYSIFLLEEERDLITKDIEATRKRLKFIVAQPDGYFL